MAMVSVVAGCVVPGPSGRGSGPPAGAKAESDAAPLRLHRYFVVPDYGAVTDPDATDWDRVAAALAALDDSATPRGDLDVGMSQSELVGPPGAAVRADAPTDSQAEVLRRLGITAEPANDNTRSPSAAAGPKKDAVRIYLRFRPRSTSISSQGTPPRPSLSFWLLQWTKREGWKGAARAAPKVIPGAQLLGVGVEALWDTYEWITSDAEPIGNPALSEEPLVSKECVDRVWTSGTVSFVQQAVDACTFVDAYIAIGAGGELEYVAGEGERAPSESFLRKDHQGWLAQTRACTEGGHCVAIRVDPNGELVREEWHETDGLPHLVWAALPSKVRTDVVVAATEPRTATHGLVGARVYTEEEVKRWLKSATLDRNGVAVVNEFIPEDVREAFAGILAANEAGAFGNCIDTHLQGPVFVLKSSGALPEKIPCPPAVLQYNQRGIERVLEWLPHAREDNLLLTLFTRGTTWAYRSARDRQASAQIHDHQTDGDRGRRVPIVMTATGYTTRVFVPVGTEVDPSAEIDPDLKLATMNDLRAAGLKKEDHGPPPGYGEIQMPSGYRVVLAPETAHGAPFFSDDDVAHPEDRALLTQFMIVGATGD